MKSKKFLDIFLIFLYLNPFIDLLTSLTMNIFPISVGIIIRSIFLVFLVIYTFFINKKNFKQNIIYFATIILYILSFTILTINFKGSSILYQELQDIFKIFYFPILLLCIYNLKININYKHYIYVSLIYMGLIFIPLIFNISGNGYTQGKVGAIGWFNSLNEISAILSIFSIFIIKYLFSNNKLIYKIPVIILTLIVYLSIGSKMPIISLIISLIYYLIKWLKKQSFKLKLITIGSILFILLGSLIIIPKTNFYQNIKTHLDYLEIDRVDEIVSYKFINRFIFSDRLTFLENTNERYSKSPLIVKLLGIYYRLGLIGFIIFLIPLFISTKDLKKKNKEEKFSIILAIFISLLAGHVLTSPSVSYDLGILISNKNKEENS